jgi:hypothetical protein
MSVVTAALQTAVESIDTPEEIEKLVIEAEQAFSIIHAVLQKAKVCLKRCCGSPHTSSPTSEGGRDKTL